MRSRGGRQILAGFVIALGAFLGSRALFALSVPNRGAAEPDQRAPKSIEEISQIIDNDAAKPLFDGTVNGWRLAPDEVLESENQADRNLSLSCDAKPAGSETKTDLDFTLSYLPSGLKLESVSGPAKWVCDGKGLSVAYEYSLISPYGGSIVWAERAVWGRRALAVRSAHDLVEGGSINGNPAIFIHPADDASGLGGQPTIIVIEDDTPPEFTILRIAGDQGISFDELLKIAEGAK